MRHPSTLAAHAYWLALHDAGGPSRERIEPGAIRHALPDVFLLDGLRSQEPVFALAGTRVCAALGGEMRGRPFLDRLEGNEDLLDALVGVGAGEVQEGICVARSESGFDFRFEMALMPLSHRGMPRSAALGVLAPVGPDVWGGQALLAWRYATAPAPAPAAPGPAPVRSRLRLLLGGRAHQVSAA